MTVTIPTSEAQYGYVVGRVIRALGDSADADDKPDAVAAAGKITFTPKATLGRTTDYSAFVVREKIDAPLDAQGNLVRYEGATPAGISLTVGAYRVEFTLTSGSIPSFDIEVTAAHTQAAPLDLVTAAPYVPPSGVTVQTMLVPADAVVGQVLSWSASGLDWVDMAAAAGGVSSVAGRTGAVVLSSADLTDVASLATDAELTSGLAGKANSSHTHAAADITSGTIAAGRLPTASATASGIVELATTAEATAGTDTQRAVTPATARAAGDARYVRTVNGTGPDPNGNVAVAGGGGAAPPAISRNVMTAQYRPLPGQVPLARDVGASAVRTTAYFYPVRAAGAWTVDAFAIKVLNVVAGGVARIWVFNADNLEQPTTLALDATGSGLPLGTAGLKEVSGLNHTFPAGNYVVVLTIAATANPTLIGVGCAPDRYELAGASWWNERIREGVSWTSPAQVTTWTASFSSTANPVNLVFWR